MIPVIPALVLAFISFISSCFVILRIVIPILPPHPLSKRVSPAEFGLPTFRSLSPADKSHIWLAGLDLLAISIFIWQTINETTGGPSGHAIANDAGSSARLWFILTIRQTCLLLVASITLLHVRMGRSVSFGAKHWMLGTPTLILALSSTAIAGIIAGGGLDSLFIGLTAYSSAVAVITSVAFLCLIGTLFNIKRNLSALNEERDPWPPVREGEEKPRPSFATEEIDAIRDGASWITSTVGSRRNSISTWSFTTHQTAMTASHHGHGRPQVGNHPSVPAKSSFWFESTTPKDAHIPPVPPLPSPYGPLSPTAEDLSDPDPFRRDVPTPLPNHPRGRLGSQTSWLTSTNGSHTTLSAWSYPTARHEGPIANDSTSELHVALAAAHSRPVTPALANAQVLGGYGYAPGSIEAEKGLAALAAPQGTTLHVSIYPTLGWLLVIWLPLGLALPYLITLSQNTTTSLPVDILFVLSVTLSSPILALNILLGLSLPIPTGLFDIRGNMPARSTSPSDTIAPYKWSHEYKRSTSMSVTVVEGRRSGDVWISKGDAVDGKNKISRAVGMLNPMPKLSVLPPDEDCQDGELTPPLPIQDGDSSLPVTIHNTPHSETSAQFGRIRKDSRASSHYYSGADESLAVASRIMVAQRHYSALAQTVVIPSSPPEKKDVLGGGVELATASGVETKAVYRTSHLRSRSATSFSGPQTPSTGDNFNISPPPSFPLPPTPPNVRAARLASLAHKKSFSSGFSFGPVDDMNQIDALSAGVLPLLVPGLKVGEDMRIKEGGWSPPGSYSKSKGKKVARKLNEFGEDFSSPEVHSTPARTRVHQHRNRKVSSHKKNHFSLPSLGLGKDGLHSLAQWSADVKGALGQYTSVPSNVEVGWRNTVFGADSIPNNIPHLIAVAEEDERPKASNPTVGLSRAMSTRSLGLRADVPHNVDTARSSVYSVNMVLPTSAASTVTLFDDFEAGLASGPLAESTPHNTVSHKPTKSAVPPMPIEYNAPNRRSSIVYIKSDDHTTISNPKSVEPTSTMASIANWSTRAVRPLMPKANKIQRKISNASHTSNTKSGSPREGLRPLALLQDRDTNVNSRNSSGSVASETRPLTLGKKHKTKSTVHDVSDENASPDSFGSGNGNLKPLKLVRSETSKMRSMLRKTEKLPEVVVRPPSTAEDAGFIYRFRG